MVMKRVRIRVTLPVGYARTVLLLCLVMICLLYPPLSVQATISKIVSNAPITYGQRQFYITKQFVEANYTWFACEDGYHFASLWELLDVSNLRYNTTFGFTNNDSAAGPPTTSHFFSGTIPVRGWVRTGYVSHTGNNAGRANCGSWLYINEAYHGTTARLPSDWVNGEKDIGVWDVEVQTCNGVSRVWCIEDSLMHYVMLPIVLKKFPQRYIPVPSM